MIEIKLLTSFTMEDEKSLGLNGFDTDVIYEVTKENSDDEMTVSLKRVTLKEPMRREWPHQESDIDLYKDIIKQGYSYGAYKDDQLVGVVMTEYKELEHSLWITEIVVADHCRHMGIGSVLWDKVIQTANRAQINYIELETQSTNYPAISFYRKNGFEVNGLDMLENLNETINNEVILKMKKLL